MNKRCLTTLTGVSFSALSILRCCSISLRFNTRSDRYLTTAEKLMVKESESMPSLERSSYVLR